VASNTQMLKLIVIFTMLFAYSNISMAQCDTGDCAMAIRAALDNMPIESSHWETNNTSKWYNLSQLYKGLHMLDSLEHCIDGSVAHERINLLLGIGTMYSKAKNYDSSLVYMYEALGVARSVNDKKNITTIYYSVAKLYIEQKLYESAIKNLELALNTANTIDNYNTTELRLNLHTTRLQYALFNDDIAIYLHLLDSLNTCIDEIGAINNAESITDICMVMSNANLDAINISTKKRNVLLNNSRKFLDVMRQAIDTSFSNKLKLSIYNPNLARYYTSCGKYKEAWNLLSDPHNFCDDEQYTKALYFYYNAIGNYKMAFVYFWKDLNNDFKNHSLENTVQFELQRSHTKYERDVAQMLKESQERNRNFEEHQKTISAVHNIVVVTIVAGVLFVILICYFLVVNTKINRQLLSSKEAISIQNDRLHSQYNEISLQTNEIYNQSRIILEQRDNLRSRNLHLRASLLIAGDIQKAIVPSSERLNEILGDNFVLWKPLNEVSGDFYWATQVATKIFLVVADCTGHGVPGALLSMYGISMLNDIVRKNNQQSAATILNILKALFIKSFVKSDAEFYDGIDMALVIFDRVDMSVNYSGARRPLWHVRDGNLTEYRPDKLSIGLNPMRNSALFTDKFFRIRTGDMLYVFSDGLADQFGDEDCSTKFGNGQLKNVLSEVSYLSTEVQKTIVESVMINWRTGSHYAGLSSIEVQQLDDELLVGVRI